MRTTQGVRDYQTTYGRCSKSVKLMPEAGWELDSKLQDIALEENHAKSEDPCKLPSKESGLEITQK